MLSHQELGRDLGIYEPHELAGAGFPLWLPDGATIVGELERYILDAERRAGYRHVRTPPVAKPELYKRSGHWEHFSEDMFPPMPVGAARRRARGVAGDEGAVRGASEESERDQSSGGDELVLRPVLCPHHILVYKSRLRSHRELPLRMAEFDQQYRMERSGVVGGLLRVRAITLNDAHVFCTEEQAAAEAELVLRMIDEAYAVLGIKPAYAMLAVRGPNKSYAGSDEQWERAESILRDALDMHGLEAKRVEGEAAFYGPKIDIQVYDANGREFTLSTVQADLVQPERFDLSYVAPSGERLRPAIVHRSVVGAMERMVAYLLETTQGALPPWLSPLQVQVLPVSPDQDAYAHELARDLHLAGIRAEVDDRSESLGARIRAARLRRVPYVAVVGAREAADGNVSIRRRDGEAQEPMPAPRLVSALSEVIASRSRDLLLG